MAIARVSTKGQVVIPAEIWSRLGIGPGSAVEFVVEGTSLRGPSDAGAGRPVISVDTDVLARFYVDDPTDPEASIQRPLSRRVLATAEGVWVPLTVVLELEWVVRALYGFGPQDFGRLTEHLCGLGNVVVEDYPAVLGAIDLHRKGLDFADALHLVRRGHCERLLTFEDRRFAREANELGVTPSVELAGA